MSLFSRIFSQRGEAGEKAEPRLPTVKFDDSSVTEDVIYDLRSTIENTDLIPTNSKLQVADAALNMVRSGGDLYSFCRAAEALEIRGISKSEIAELARYLFFRSSSLIDVNRMLAAGITEVEWRYSGAPCNGSAEQNNLHKTANGIRFALASGLDISGSRSWPGRERGCKCIMKPIINGFS